MPLILSRKPGQRTSLTFPDGSVAVVECTGSGHVAASLAPTLKEVHSANWLMISPSCDDWPVCFIELAGCVDGSSSRAFIFDAPAEVKIHRDNIRRKK